MTTHELARILLAGPDVKVVKQGHEPNDDSFDEIGRVLERIVYSYNYGSYSDLFDQKPTVPGAVADVKVVVLL